MNASMLVNPGQCGYVYRILPILPIHAHAIPTPSPCRWRSRWQGNKEAEEGESRQRIQEKIGQEGQSLSEEIEVVFVVQPPFHFTGDPKADWIILAVGALFALYWLRALRLAREGARRFLGNVIIAGLLFYGSRAILMNGMNVSDKAAFWISFCVALTVFSRKANTPRSRNIPTKVKRKVIERDLKGEKYDSSKHHIDHVWPFSKGGSHTTDNLRVIDKKKNLKKGAKRPPMKDMW